jgi:hypothetical protein
MGLHSALGVPQGIHALQAREPASFQDMLTASVVSADIGKVARKTDDGSFHVLSSVSPAMWTAITAVNSKHIYLSAANGNDANTGVIAASSVATTARAFGLIPGVISGPVIIHVGSGSYSWSKLPRPVQLNTDARIWIICDGAGNVGDDGFAVVATDTAGAGTSANQVVTTALSPALNAYQSYTLEMTSGAANGYRRTITENTAGAASVLSPARQFEAQDGYTLVNPSPGDTFRIVRPGAVFTATTGEATLFGGIGAGDAWAPLMLVNLAFDTNDGRVSIDGCTVYGAGIEWRGTNHPHMNNVRGSFGAWDHVMDAYYTVPASYSMSVAKAAWFSDIGLGTGLDNLAKWRGWGWSAPDIRSVNFNYSEINDCTISMLGVFGGHQFKNCASAVGGYFWSYCSQYNCMTEISGRGFTGKSSTFALSLIVFGGVMFQAAGEMAFTGVSGATQLIAASANLYIGYGLTMSAASNTSISALAGSTIRIGTATITSQRSLSTGGAIEASGGGRFETFGGTLSVTMTGSGLNAFMVSDGGIVNIAGALNVTGKIEVLRDGKMQTAGASTVSAATTPIRVRSGKFTQSAGTLSASATTLGHGLVCDDGDVSVLGGASTMLTGLGTGKVGALTYGDGKIRYQAQPTGVSGTAGDLQCGTASPVADTVLAVEGSSTADASGANRQIMAAVAA